MPPHQFSNIIVAVDGSENSEKAARVAIVLAKVLRARLTIAQVLESQGFLEMSEPAMSKTVESVVEAHFARLREKATQFCNTLVSTAREQGLDQVSMEILELGSSHSAVETIIDFAEKKEADLIVVGSRGLGTFRKLFIGSVSNGVVNHAHCSVLVVK